MGGSGSKARSELKLEAERKYLYALTGGEDDGPSGAGSSSEDPAAQAFAESLLMPLKQTPLGLGSRVMEPRAWPNDRELREALEKTIGVGDHPNQQLSQLADCGTVYQRGKTNKNGGKGEVELDRLFDMEMDVTKWFQRHCPERRRGEWDLLFSSMPKDPMGTYGVRKEPTGKLDTWEERTTWLGRILEAHSGEVVIAPPLPNGHAVGLEGRGRAQEATLA